MPAVVPSNNPSASVKPCQHTQLKVSGSPTASGYRQSWHLCNCGMLEKQHLTGAEVHLESREGAAWRKCCPKAKARCSLSHLAATWGIHDTTLPALDASISRTRPGFAWLPSGRQMAPGLRLKQASGSIQQAYPAAIRGIDGIIHVGSMPPELLEQLPRLDAVHSYQAVVGG